MMFRKTAQEMVVAPPSTESTCVSDQSTTSSSCSSRPRYQSPCRPVAQVDEPACSPVELSKARIESTFKRIEYIEFKNKPACLIVIDVRFIYNKNYLMRSAKIEINFSKDPNSSADNTSFPRTTDTFGPKEFFGEVESTTCTQNYGLSTPPKLGGIDIPVLKGDRSHVQTQKKKWHIQGIRAKQGSSQSYNWTIYDNDLTDFESFPRTVTLWMIVEHDNTPFHAQLHMDGKLRGHMATNAAAKLKSYRLDSRDIQKALVLEGSAPELGLDPMIVNGAQNLLACLAAAKLRANSRLFTPPTCASVALNQEQLRVALISGLWNEDIISYAEESVSEIEDVNSFHFHIPSELARSLFGNKRKPIAPC